MIAICDRRSKSKYIYDSSFESFFFCKCFLQPTFSLLPAWTNGSHRSILVSRLLHWVRVFCGFKGFSMGSSREMDELFYRLKVLGCPKVSCLNVDRCANYNWMNVFWLGKQQNIFSKTLRNPMIPFTNLYISKTEVLAAIMVLIILTPTLEVDEDTICRVWSFGFFMVFKNLSSKKFNYNIRPGNILYTWFSLGCMGPCIFWCTTPTLYIYIPIYPCWKMIRSAKLYNYSILFETNYITI